MALKDSKVIVLRGEGESGKTTTLNKLIKKMLSFPFSTLERSSKYDETKDKETKDRWVVIKYGNRHIAVITAGDGKRELESNFKAVQNNFGKPIDLYVCPSRSKDATLQYIRDNFNKSDIIWVRKCDVFRENKNEDELIEKVRFQSNEIQALALLEMIDKI